MSSLCIIPARGGSKRIPKKNIKNFFGKPIIAYAIETAIKADIFDKIIVSTDDKEIMGVAKEFGADVPFTRTAENSNDFATTLDVVEEVLENFNKRKETFQTVCCLYPCNPLLEWTSLTKAFELLNQNSDVVIPVVPYSFPIQRAFRIKKGFLSYFHPEHEKSRSQDLEQSYHDAGQFYFFKPSIVLTEKTLVPKKTTYLIFNEMDVQDIDNPMDWKLAELKYQAKINGVSRKI